MIEELAKDHFEVAQAAEKLAAEIHKYLYMPNPSLKNLEDALYAYKKASQRVSW